jgi:HSP20 family protein
MALIRWEPTRELSSLQDEMNRLFSTFFDTPGQAGNGGTGMVNRWIPAMDLVEQDEDYVLRADLPGMREDDVNIELENNVLSISGERKHESTDTGKGFYRIERASGPFSRSLTLPEGVDAGAIAASFQDGVLELRIPKPEQRKPHRVRISAGAGKQPDTIEG